LTVSLVAILGGEILGHAAFSGVTINGETDGWYGLGPVSVRPAQQRKGIGQALINEGLDRLKAMQAKGCVVEGDPRYYRRFGFANVPGLCCRNVPQAYFQCLVFKGPPPEGVVEFHPGFDAT
jgi:putative acetyltransferase